MFRPDYWRVIDTYSSSCFVKELCREFLHSEAIIQRLVKLYLDIILNMINSTLGLSNREACKEITYQGKRFLVINIVK